ncbi:MAG: class I SAM-dependent methyltransferase [Bacteroidetes bacterium]|nr:class I SAM-dependent methyltransferase [Bacteroidota bacterium]MBU2586340.1 class I SAM-dependent methyltransferase [Bacteroidota bacterium]
MNDLWTEHLFRKLHPDYRHRWEVYNEVLRKLITKDTVWLDIGCGTNEHVAEFGNMAKTAIGIDILDNGHRANAPFLRADLRNIPLPSSYASLITLRMVTEHLERVPQDFSEIDRLLVPGGTLLLLTTNSSSPIIFLPRLLPFSLKRWLIGKLFGVPCDDVFPTYHRFNTLSKMIDGVFNMKLSSLEFLEQVPLHRPLLTCIFGLWYSVTRFSPLRCFKSNLLAVFHKISSNDIPEP